MSHTSLRRIAVGFASVCALAGPAVADELAEAKARIDALKPERAVSAVATWLNGRAVGCRIELAPDDLNEASIIDVMRRAAGAPAALRPELSVYFRDVMASREDFAAFDVELFFDRRFEILSQSDTLAVVQIRDCQFPAS